MIYYNFPYRGPYDYDKFVISILQYCNEAEYLLNELKKDTEGFMLESKRLDEELDNIRKENRAEKLRHTLKMIR